MHPLSLGTKGSDAVVLDSLAVEIETVAVGTHLHLLGRCRYTDAEDSG